MIKDFIANHNLHLFMVFFVFIFIRWGIVYFNAVRYKPYQYPEDKINFFTSVVIPVVDEPLDLFDSVLRNIAAQRPSEIIIVINGPRNKALESICKQLHKEIGDTTIIKGYHTNVPGKRNAIDVAMKRIDPRSDITLLVDSDTVWTEKTLIELLKPFACDKKIGGVTTRQKILDPNRKLVTMFANLLEEIRAEGTMKAMSVTGKVGCLPGRTIAFRTKILLECMDEFMNETFMGFHKEVSDDRALTNLTLKMGYKTVMQDTSVVYTDAPTQWKKFVRQQLRWAEGSQYNNLKMTPWMFKNAKLMAFIYWSDMIMPMMLISVYANTFICQILNRVGYNIPTLNYTDAWWQILLFIILGCIFSFGARNINVMRQLKWYYTPMIPIFIAVLTVVMVPVRLLGLMRCSDDLGWGTRKLQEDEDEKETEEDAAGLKKETVPPSDDNKQ